MAEVGFSRRSLFKVGGGAAAGLALAGTGAAVARGVGQGAAADPQIPVSKAFDLKDPADALLMHKQAWCPSVMQSFGIDHLNGHLYVVQVMFNPDDGVPYSKRRKEGDLAVTKLSLDGSTKLGRMYLRGFGHGAQIGVEPTAKGSAPYIWVEYDSKVNKEGKVGYGQKVCRIKYVGPDTGKPPRSFHWDNDTDRKDMDFQDKMPDLSTLPGSGSISSPRAVIDPVNRRLMLRLTRGGGHQAAVYDLDHAAENQPSKLVGFRDKLPQTGTSQGFCLFGSYAYLLEGNSYKNGGPGDPDDKGNTYITRVDLNTGEKTRELTRALKSLTYREPEGMGIHATDNPRLCFAFSSGASNDRRVNIAYKDKLV
ncbi:hypothetical protein [Streptomyces sp. NPDC005438]|uniref:phage baseplate protein n=1 Tax=Streptomyces sp. NPDC005438 TaxID=3156880 RepID=UPI0033B56BD6